MNTSVQLRTRHRSREKRGASKIHEEGHRGARDYTPNLTYPLLSTVWEQNAVASFFQNYVLEPINGRQGYLDFLPQLYHAAADNHCLRDSTLAVALASFANVSSMQCLSIRSQHHYGRALQSVRVALSTPEQAKTDQVLATIVLLQKFEVSSTTIALNDI